MEKESWLTSVQPYKCDNARRLVQLNHMQKQKIMEIDNYLTQLNENMQKMSQIANERDLFKRKYDHLNGKVKKLEEEDLNGKKQKLPDTAIFKKPFVSTVRCGTSKASASANNNNASRKCIFCSSVYVDKCQPSCVIKQNKTEQLALKREIVQLKNEVSINEEKVKLRDEENNRLRELLEGGRPMDVLVKECCCEIATSLKQSMNKINWDVAETKSQLKHYRINLGKSHSKRRQLEDSLLSAEEKINQYKEIVQNIEKEKKELEGKIAKYKEKNDFIKKDIEGVLFNLRSENHHLLKQISLLSKQLSGQEVKCLLNKRAKTLKHKLHCNDASFITDMKENINTNRSVSKEDDTEKPLLLVCVDRTEVIPKQELASAKGTESEKQLEEAHSNAM